ncbi:hypothetical protein ACQKM9_20105 [Viridibacillus sp. NPDC093762]|uniref:hypothetical protein n=1 Tax=Viridibacillus sp. NPDC093762 TaxID=3390720 RepID=UPI003CFEC0F1
MNKLLSGIALLSLTTLLTFNNDTALANTENTEPVKINQTDRPNDLNTGDNNENTDALVSIRKISDDPNYLKKQYPFGLISPLGAGQWDYLGESTFKTQSSTFNSGGGDLLIYIEQPYGGFGGPKWWYKLYEEDPGWDSVVSDFELDNKAGTYEMIFNVRDWVDGDNNKAELHLSKLYYPTTSVYTIWLD